MVGNVFRTCVKKAILENFWIAENTRIKDKSAVFKEKVTDLYKNFKIHKSTELTEVEVSQHDGHRNERKNSDGGKNCVCLKPEKKDLSWDRFIFLSSNKVFVFRTAVESGPEKVSCC